MMPCKFAIVREDPDVEMAILQRLSQASQDTQKPRRALLVASGGCTALSVLLEMPDVDVHVYDFNPRQLQLLDEKRALLLQGLIEKSQVQDAAQNNTEQECKKELAQWRHLSTLGEFEKLFRVWRCAFLELVADEKEIENYFSAAYPYEKKQEIASSWINHPRWQTLFHVAFNDAFLVALFGPAAVQHAPVGSYPAYFAGVFARGLLRADGSRNPFLQHIFCGIWQDADAPRYWPAHYQPTHLAHLASEHSAQLSRLIQRLQMPIPQTCGTLLDVSHIDTFDLVHLSNIPDWSSDDETRACAQFLQQMKQGSIIVIRQLNNERPVRDYFAPHFVFDTAWGQQLQAQDRSLFYNRIEVGVRV